MSLELSVVVPACNEADNVEPLAREIHAALQGRAYEMIFVDDGSTDDTHHILVKLKGELPTLRVLRHSFRSGQSAGVASGVRAARAPWIATLDGDGQNDPADIPKLIAARDANRGVQLVVRVYDPGPRPTWPDKATNNELRAMRERLAMFERRQVLYSTDELDLTGDLIKLLQVPLEKDAAEPAKTEPPKTPDKPERGGK